MPQLDDPEEVERAVVGVLRSTEDGVLRSADDVVGGRIVVGGEEVGTTVVAGTVPTTVVLAEVVWPASTLVLVASV